MKPTLLIALALSGCAYNQSSLVHQASADLRCPEAQVQVARTDSNHRVVSGCGHQAEYELGRNGWVAAQLDGRANPTAADAGAPPLPSQPPPSAVQPVPPVAPR